MVGEDVADARIAALEDEAGRLKERLAVSRTHQNGLRRLLRWMVFDSAAAHEVRALVEEGLAQPGWMPDELALVREQLVPLWNFAWLVPDRLAGSSRPDTALAVRTLAEAGVRTIVSLDEPPEASWLARHGIEVKHVRGFADQAAPTDEQLGEAVGAITASLAGNKPVVVHCMAGLGRTGTVLAAYLVSQGASPDEAIAEVRRVYNPRALDNAAQEAAVRRCAAGRPRPAAEVG